MRIPHDETGRLISATFWKMANMIKNGGNANDIQGIFALGAGQLPSVTANNICMVGYEYLSGKNLSDFRGQLLTILLLPQEVWPSLKKNGTMEYK